MGTNGAEGAGANQTILPTYLPGCDATLPSFWWLNRNGSIADDTVLQRHDIVMCNSNVGVDEIDDTKTCCAVTTNTDQLNVPAYPPG